MSTYDPAEVGTCCTDQPFPSGSPKNTNRPPGEVLDLAHDDPMPDQLGPGDSMSGTTSCSPWTVPGSASTIPVPRVIEQADPGVGQLHEANFVAHLVIVVGLKPTLST